MKSKIFVFFCLVASAFATTYPAQSFNLREEMIRRGLAREEFGTALNFFSAPTKYRIIVDGGIWPLTANRSISAHITLDIQAGSYFQSTNGSTLTINGGLIGSGQAMFDCEVAGLSYATPSMFLSNGVARAQAAVSADADRASKFSGVTLGSTTLTSWETGLSSYATTNALGALNSNFATSQSNFSNLQTYVNGTLVPQVNTNFSLTELNFGRGNALMADISNNFAEVYTGVNQAFLNAAAGMTNVVPAVLALPAFSWNWAANAFATNYTSVSNMSPLDLTYAYISNLFVTVDSYAGYNRALGLNVSNLVTDLNLRFVATSNAFTDLADYLTNSVDGVVPVMNQNTGYTTNNFTVLNSNMALFADAFIGVQSQLTYGVYNQIVALNPEYTNVVMAPTSTFSRIPYSNMNVSGYAYAPTALDLDLSEFVLMSATNYVYLRDDLDGWSGTLTDYMSTNDTRYAALNTAHTNLNHNFTNIALAYAETTNAVNSNATLQASNMTVFNNNQELLSNQVASMAGYIYSSFTNLAGGSGYTANMGWNYPYAEQEGEPVFVTNALSLSYVDLRGAVSALAGAQVTNNAATVVVNSVKVTGFGASGFSSCSFGPSSLGTWVDGVNAPTPGSGWSYQTMDLDGEGSYIIYGHWGPLTNGPSYMIFGGQPSNYTGSADGSIGVYNSYNYLPAANGVFSFPYYVPSTMADVVFVYVPAGERTNEIPIQMNYKKLELSK